MKLELKHIAPYLPYGLKCLNDNLPDTNITIDELIGISNHIVWSGIFSKKHGSTHVPICGIKPILRPLSDLTKEIEENGEKFVPQKKLSHLDLEWLIKSDNLIMKTNYEDVLLLLEWHFDIYNLIPNNLAIDINTLKL